MIIFKSILINIYIFAGYNMKMHMKLRHIHIFGILLLALLLCSFLGGNCGTKEGLDNATQRDIDSNVPVKPVQATLRGNNNQGDPYTAVRKTDIPHGQEDLYVLRSEVANLLKNSETPPCPPCARCPEPSFECKKVPNYKSANANDYLPRPVLSDFSSFGM
jgi:hypothetical protein